MGLDEELRIPENKYGKTKRIAHSWCELGDIVIDHQNIVNIPPNTVLEHVTIVKKKEELEGKVDYKSVGREFRSFGKSFVYIPIYVTMLRI